MSYPWGIYVDVNGTLFVADRNNHRIQRFTSGSFIGTTVAGSSTDAGPYAYQLSSPTSIVFDPFGYLYILDTGNNRVQKWLPGASYGTTVIATSMSTPLGLIVDPIGGLVISDTNNHRIISFALSCRTLLNSIIKIFVFLFVLYLASSTTSTAAPPSKIS